MNYNFKKITSIPEVDIFVNAVLSKTQRKTPTEIHPQFDIHRIRTFYMRKVKFTAETINEKLTKIVVDFPKLDDIHPFYADLINVLYDRDHYKIALGHISSAKNIITNISKDYIRLIKYGDSLYRCKMLKRAGLGRMVTCIKKLKATLSYLEEVRKHLARMPAIDPFARTLLVTGFPNVGKSSFVNNVTNANVDVQPYPFTTQSIFVGHFEDHSVRWQVLDTPGILDTTLEQRTNIEMQSITALAHLKACILFFFDISESCGESIEKQISLFNNIKPTFLGKPHLIVLTKSDLKKFSELEPDRQELILQLCSENNVEMIAMSNKNKDGIEEVKQKACEMLLTFRMNNPAISKASIAEERKITDIQIVHPTKKRDDLEIIPNIPDAILRGEKPSLGRPTLKEMEDKFGGPGGFYFPAQEHFILENPDWKYDVIPEFYNGKNIVDFVDPDILKKLEKLEEEEEMLLGNLNTNPMEGETDDLDPEMLEAYKEIQKKKSEKIYDHLMKKKKKDYKKVKKLGDLKSKLQEKGIDPSKVEERFRDNKRRPLSEGMQQEASGMDLEDNNSDMEDQDKLGVRLKKKAIIARNKHIRSRSKSSKTPDEIAKLKEQQKSNYNEQWRRNQDGRAGEADRHVHIKMPKHLYTGKRGIGHADRRQL